MSEIPIQENTEQYSNKDPFILTDTLDISSADSFLYKMKSFLSAKFKITFNLTDNFFNNEKDVIDILYERMESAAYGFSFSFLNEYIFPSYMHTKNPFLPPSCQSYEKKTNEFLNLIKQYCIFSSFYTVCAISDKDNYMKLADVARIYSNKKYNLIKDSEEVWPPFWEFSGSDTEVRNRLYSNYDALIPKNMALRKKSKNQSAYDIKYLKNSFLFRISKENSSNDNFDNFLIRREINSYLDEFSYDLLVNQTNFGFNLDLKLQTIRKYYPDGNVNNFRREINRFIEGLVKLDALFHPSAKSANNHPILCSLYYWKKESLLRIELFKHITNAPEKYMHIIDQLLDLPVFFEIEPFFKLITGAYNNGHSKIEKEHQIFYLNFLNQITIPVFTYTFFIYLIKYFGDLLNIKRALTDYIENHSFKMNFSEKTISPITRENASTFGKSVMTYFISNSYLPTKLFDNAFISDCSMLGPDIDNISFLQAAIAQFYYEQIIK